MNERQLRAQMSIINILMKQGITNFYLAHDSKGHALYSQSSDMPVFSATSDAQLVTMFQVWCHSTPNEDIDIVVTPF